MEVSLILCTLFNYSSSLISTSYQMSFAFSKAQCLLALVVSLGVSIKVDTIQKLYPMPTRRYYRYGDLNYIVHKYLVKLDTCQLIAEQCEELIKDLSALKNLKVSQQQKPLEGMIHCLVRILHRVTYIFWSTNLTPKGGQKL